MKYTGPKAKRCRKHGVNIYGSDKYDRILQRKPYPPGKGPRDRRGKQSEYALQLLEKQKVRDTFGVSERQFRRYYKTAQTSKGATGTTILSLLETRLDNVLYRAGLALTRPQARQMVSHGLFCVNGRRVTTPSRHVKPGDAITVRERSAHSPLFSSVVAATEKYMPPSWLKVNPGTLHIEMQSIPAEEAFEQDLDIQKVVELYSR